MAKRFTRTDKWGEEWFQDLSLAEKAFWQYINDNCDCAGVWKINWKLASFQIGTKITADILKAFGKRVKAIADDMLWVTIFIDEQYDGNLSPNCKPHQPIIKTIAKHGLLTNNEVGKECLSIETDSLSPSIQVNLLANNGSDSLLHPISSLKEKDKEQEKEKENGEEVQEKGGNPVSTRFQKPSPEEIAAHGEKISLPETERIKFLSYYESNGWRVGKNPMKDWRAAMVHWRTNWQERGGGLGQRSTQSTTSGPSINSIAQADSVIAECVKRLEYLRNNSDNYTSKIVDGFSKKIYNPKVLEEVAELKAKLEETKKLKTGMK